MRGKIGQLVQNLLVIVVVVVIVVVLEIAIETGRVWYCVTGAIGIVDWG